MSYSSLVDSGRITIAKLINDNLDFYLGFGELPSNYADTWDIDENVPSYIAKKIENENIVRSNSSDIDYLTNKDVHSVLEVTSNPVSSLGVLNSIINIVGTPGTQGNIQVVVTPGGFSGSETLNFSNGVLTAIIENNVTTRQQLANLLMTSPLIQSATVISNPNTVFTVGIGSDNVYLVGGKDLVIYTENTDFKIGYIDNSDNIPLGAIKWIGTIKPSNDQTYIVDYWYKDILSNQTGLLQAFGFKKAVSKTYVIEDLNGSIKANDKKWSISLVPTKHLALMFFIDNLDIPDGKVIRQFGLFTGIVPNTGFDPSHFYTVDQITNLGSLMVIDNLAPYKHETINSEQITIVLSL